MLKLALSGSATRALKMDRVRPFGDETTVRPNVYTEQLICQIKEGWRSAINCAAFSKRLFSPCFRLGIKHRL